VCAFLIASFKFQDLELLNEYCWLVDPKGLLLVSTEAKIAH
jgi:hypothetical protein